MKRGERNGDKEPPFPFSSSFRPGNKTGAIKFRLIFVYLLLFTRPTTLDVMVYGHMHALMTTDLPSNDLATVALRFKNLGDFCRTTVPGMTLSQAQVTSS